METVNALGSGLQIDGIGGAQAEEVTQTAGLAPPPAASMAENARCCTKCGVATEPPHDKRACKCNVLDIASSWNAAIPVPHQCGTCNELIDPSQLGECKACHGFCSARLYHVTCLPEGTDVSPSVWYCPACMSNMWAPRGLAAANPVEVRDGGGMDATAAALALNKQLQDALASRSNNPQGGGFGAPVTAPGAPRYPRFLADLGTDGLATQFSKDAEMATMFNDWLAKQSIEASKANSVGARFPFPTQEAQRLTGWGNGQLGSLGHGGPLGAFGHQTTSIDRRVASPGDGGANPGQLGMMPSSPYFSSPNTLKALTSSGELRKSALRIVDFMPANALSLREDEGALVYRVVDGELTQQPKKKQTHPTDVVQWMQAQVQIIFILSSDGVPLESLLVYTLRILEFSQRFDFNHVYWYDKIFRDRQFAMNSSWAAENHDLFTSILMRPEALKKTTRTPYLPKEGGEPSTSASCRRFNSGTCPFGSNCRYPHVCSSCGKSGHGQSACTSKAVKK